MNAEEIGLVLSRITSAPFEVTTPHPKDLVNADRPIWLVSYRDASYVSKVPYVQRASENVHGEIRLESAKLADTVELIESAYGEEAAAKSLDIDYSNFGGKEFRVEFGSEYPLVFRRIQGYELIANQVSKSRGVDLELRKSESKGIVFFTFAAKLVPGSRSLKEGLETNVRALKEAWNLAIELEDNRT